MNRAPVYPIWRQAQHGSVRFFWRPFPLVHFAQFGGRHSRVVSNPGLGLQLFKRSHANVRELLFQSFGTTDRSLAFLATRLPTPDQAQLSVLSTTYATWSLSPLQGTALVWDSVKGTHKEGMYLNAHTHIHMHAGTEDADCVVLVTSSSKTAQTCTAQEQFHGFQTNTTHF